VRFRCQHLWVFSFVLALGSPSPSAGGNDAWKPRLEKDGETRELGDHRQVKDKDWLTIRYGEYSEYKTRLGVMVSEGENAYTPKYKKTLVKLIMDLSGKPEMMSQPQNYIEDLVRQALASTHRFNLLERTTATKDILAEQAAGVVGRTNRDTAAAHASGDRHPVDASTADAHVPGDNSQVEASAAAVTAVAAAQTSGDKGHASPGPAAENASVDVTRLDPSTAAQTGRIKGVEYLVKATLIELNPEKDTKEIKAADADKDGSTGTGLDLGVKSKVSFCRMNFRIVQVESGEIVVDETVDGTATSTSLTGAAGFGLKLFGKAAGAVARGKSKKQSPISDAMQVCANKVAYSAAMKLEEAGWQGTVASVEGTRVTIVGGTDVGLSEGMTLTLIAKGADIIDPETSQVVGFETSEIGQVKIVSTQERLSTCEIIQGGEGAKQGDLVRRESPRR
jgi:curli biogenesis system outer membrane secretion channel CsgG